MAGRGSIGVEIAWPGMPMYWRKSSAKREIEPVKRETRPTTKHKRSREEILPVARWCVVIVEVTRKLGVVFALRAEGVGVYKKVAVVACLAR